MTNIGLRVKILIEKSLNYRIRQTHNQKIPYYLVVGKQELVDKKLKLTYTYSPIKKNEELVEKELYEKLKEKNT